MQHEKLVKEIVAEVISEIMTRSGFQDLWENLEPDTRKDILEACRTSVSSVLKRSADKRIGPMLR